MTQKEKGKEMKREREGKRETDRGLDKILLDKDKESFEKKMSHTLESFF